MHCATSVRRSIILVRSSLRSFRNSAALPLLGGGLIAGLAALGRGFANSGLEIGNMSARLGVGGKALQDWRKTAELAGDSAEDATASFAGLASAPPKPKRPSRSSYRRRGRAASAAIDPRQLSFRFDEPKEP